MLKYRSLEDGRLCVPNAAASVSISSTNSCFLCECRAYVYNINGMLAVYRHKDSVLTNAVCVICVCVIACACAGFVFASTSAGELLLARTLLAADSPVTVIAIGPLTNLAWVLDNFPEASSKIDKVLIMGERISGGVSFVLYCL